MISPKNIKGFDSLRAIYILLVLMTHLGLYRYFEFNSFLKSRVWLLCSGLTGVQIFFTISGFLISHLLYREKQRNDKINIKHFFVRRFIRLLPPLILFYIIMLLTMFLGFIPQNNIGLLFSVCYLYNFIPNLFYSGELGHMWSLSVEEQFYLFWPFVLAAVSSYKKIFWGTLFLLILCLIGTYIIPTWTLHYKTNSFPLNTTFQLERWFIPAIAPVMIGALTATVLNFKYDWIQKIIARGMSVLIVAILLFLSPLFLPAEMLPISNFFQSIGVGMILLLLYFNQESKAVNYFNYKWLAYFGKISYGIYVYQGFFLRTGPGGSLWVQQYPVNVICTILLAVLSYEYYEKKILKLKLRFNHA